MTFDEVMKQLEDFGDEQTKKTLMRHGAKEPLFGVKVASLKIILKKTKKNHTLALELFRTGNSDAMYLAGLIADEKRMTKELLNEWVSQAYWFYLSEFTVPWVASETPFGLELGLEWIESDEETISAAGWATLASVAALKNDNELDIDLYSKLLDRAALTIFEAKNRTRYAMNSFVIAIGTYIKDLTDKAIKIGNRIDKVEVILGSNACKVPYAPEYIQKIIEKGKIGKKRKSARC